MGHGGPGEIQVRLGFQLLAESALKGIVSRDFRCLQMILMDRIVVPDVPLEVYYFLNFRFHIVF